MFSLQYAPCNILTYILLFHCLLNAGAAAAGDHDGCSGGVVDGLGGVGGGDTSVGGAGSSRSEGGGGSRSEGGGVSRSEGGGGSCGSGLDVLFEVAASQLHTHGFVTRIAPLSS